MFTGIIEEMGKVVSARGSSLEIASGFDDLKIGDSIAVNGVCLTVVSFQREGFKVDLSEETLKRTNLGTLDGSSKVNLERSLPVGGRFGGHFVQGHVDAAARIERINEREGSVEMRLKVPHEQLRYLVEKGSVALDGVSLTVNGIGGSEFGVSLIPHTLATTTLGERSLGDTLNLETDVLAKYVERLLARQAER